MALSKEQFEWLKIARVPTRLRRVDFRRAKKRHRPGEGLFTWQKGKKASAFLPLAEWLGLPSEITVRLLRVQIKQAGFRTQHLTLVTTLLDQTLYPSEEIMAAYARRWRLEIVFGRSKNDVEHGTSTVPPPDMVQKQRLIFFIVHNLLRSLMIDAALSGEVCLERISFKGSLDGFRQWTVALAELGTSKRYAKKRAGLWSELLQTLAADLVPERPGRREPRAVKKRSKYPHLDCPRRKYRERMSRNKRRSRALARKASNAI